MVDPVGEPLVRVDLVECYAGLEDVEEREAFVVDRLLHHQGEVVPVACVASGDEAAIERYGQGERV